MLEGGAWFRSLPHDATISTSVKQLNLMYFGIFITKDLKKLKAYVDTEYRGSGKGHRSIVARQRIGGIREVGILRLRIDATLVFIPAKPVQHREIDPCRADGASLDDILKVVAQGYVLDTKEIGGIDPVRCCIRDRIRITDLAPRCIEILIRCCPAVTPDPDGSGGAICSIVDGPADI